MRDLLTIKNLNKSFDGVTPVKNVSFTVKRQGIMLVTGENGAGKTTLFNLITGLESPTKGKIVFKGEDITGKSALEIAKHGIVRLYQQPRLFKNLLVWENLVSAAHQYDRYKWRYDFNVWKNLISAARQYASNSLLYLIFKPKLARQEEDMLKHKANILLSKFGLQDLSHQIAGELSYGQQKMISFCMLAMNGAQLALLDEPFAGLNPQIIERFSNMILAMKGEGMTFLIIEHNIHKALVIADSHIEMKDGSIMAITPIVET